MARQRTPAEPPPPCYAMVLPGLEDVAAEEITQRLRGEVKRAQPGIVVFRGPEIDAALFELRTTEDVFVLAWGTDALTLRAEDLEKIRRWTARSVDWARLLQIHHALRPKPKGRPSYRLVTQMTGERGYRRVDAQRAMAEGLAGKLPASWRPAEENAAIEIWLTISGPTAVCGLRLTDRTMRHRTYKLEHLPASLRPTLAAAMVRLAGARAGHVVLDPMCGAGTILAEQLAVMARFPAAAPVWGGDLDAAALRAAGINLRRLGRSLLARWNALRLPLAEASVDRIVTNPPFGKQLSRPEEIGPLYRRLLPELDRVLRPGGRAVLLVSDWPALRAAVSNVPWTRAAQHRVRVLGQPALLTVWRKAQPDATIPEAAVSRIEGPNHAARQTDLSGVLDRSQALEAGGGG